MAANVKGLSVIDSEGTRVVAKYYSADLRSAAERVRNLSNFDFLLSLPFDTLLKNK